MRNRRFILIALNETYSIQKFQTKLFFQELGTDSEDEEPDKAHRSQPIHNPHIRATQTHPGPTTHREIAAGPDPQDAPDVRSSPSGRPALADPPME